MDDNHNTKKPERREPFQYPAFDLRVALAKTEAVYRSQFRRLIPASTAAQDMGYRSSTSGAAVATLATLRQYNLIERPRAGFVAVTKDYEIYTLSRNQAERNLILRSWLKAPKLFGDLLALFPDVIPAPDELTDVLLKMGMSPGAAEQCVKAFLGSLEVSGLEIPYTADADLLGQSGLAPLLERTGGPTDTERILVRLAGDRRAFIEIPRQFYAGDKERIRRQLDALYADDDQ